MHPVFRHQILLHSSSLGVRQSAIVDQDLSDIPIKVAVVKAGTDARRRPDARNGAELAILPQG